MKLETFMNNSKFSLSAKAHLYLQYAENNRNII